MAIGEANGKSSTFTIKKQSATQTDCAGALWCTFKSDSVFSIVNKF